MSSPISEEQGKAREQNPQAQIKDHQGYSHFTNTLAKVKDSQSAQKCYDKSDNGRLGDTMSMHEAAYTYLALGWKLQHDENIVIRNPDGSELKAKDMFHFAGHAFREIGQINRAADAYWRAGIQGTYYEDDEKILKETVRSFARAKACFNETGEIGNSDRMHRLEWEVRRNVADKLKFWLWLWNITSHYGTSFGCWLISMSVFVIYCLLLYEVFHWLNWISREKEWTPIITGLYYTVITISTLGYGDFYPVHWVSQLLVSFNVAAGYVLLGIGLTIIGVKVIRR